MATFSTGGKPTYVYNLSTNTWHQVGAKVDTSAGYEWGGSHTFLNTSLFKDHMVVEDGFNNFLNPTIRDSVLPTPARGTTCFVRQDSVGDPLNQIQFYNGTEWIGIISGTLIAGKGEILVGTAANQFTNLPVGEEGDVLVVDESTETGLSWQPASGTLSSLLFMGG